jgi:R3H domain
MATKGPINRRVKPPRQSQHIVNEYLRIAVQKSIDEFIADPEATKCEFPPSLTREQRAYIHEYVKEKNLKSKSFGKGGIFNGEISCPAKK